MHDPRWSKGSVARKVASSGEPGEQTMLRPSGWGCTERRERDGFGDDDEHCAGM